MTYAHLPEKEIEERGPIGCSHPIAYLFCNDFLTLDEVKQFIEVA